MKKSSLQPPVSSLQGFSLVRFVAWSHQLICEVLQPGDLAVDLTAGKGRDTLVLAEAVGASGQVVAFDVQPAALDQTTELLQSQGLEVKRCSPDQIMSRNPGVFLVRGCHSTLGKILPHPVKAITANLGYLPGGDPALITCPHSTLAALKQSLKSLAPGGRLAVTVYPSHPGGAEEGAVVDALFRDLPRSQWQVLSLRSDNCDDAPYLLVAEHCS